jgi:uncharacterized membrane protein
LACVLGTGGLALAARGLTPTDFGHLLGFADDPYAVQVHKTLTVAGPVERVYPYFANYQNFPRFMRHLRAIRDLGGGRSHWEAVGPAG